MNTENTQVKIKGLTIQDADLYIISTENDQILCFRRRELERKLPTLIVKGSTLVCRINSYNDKASYNISAEAVVAVEVVFSSRRGDNLLK